MKVKKIKSDVIILYENTEAKLKICVTCREIQFISRNNNKCPIQNLSEDKHMEKETGAIKERVMAMEMIRITETIMAGTSIRTKTRIRTKAIAATMVNT